jgi:hypothetical protein
MPRIGPGKHRLLTGRKCPIWWVMTGAEFLRKITGLGRRRGVAVHFDRRHGKGSHGTLHYASRKTTLKDLRQEIGAGLLSAMLAQLGLNRRDLDE